MIVIDTSALLAILLDEAGAERCAAVLETEEEVLISAGTLAEALIVAERRDVTAGLTHLVDQLGFSIVPVTATTAADVAAAYRRWGKGLHAAGLNFGDCFAYALARERGAPLLYVGEDFSRTDIRAAS